MSFEKFESTTERNYIDNLELVERVCSEIKKNRLKRMQYHYDSDANEWIIHQNIGIKIYSIICKDHEFLQSKMMFKSLCQRNFPEFWNLKKIEMEEKYNEVLNSYDKIYRIYYSTRKFGSNIVSYFLENSDTGETKILI